MSRPVSVCWRCSSARHQAEEAEVEIVAALKRQILHFSLLNGLRDLASDGFDHRCRSGDLNRAGSFGKPQLQCDVERGAHSEIYGLSACGETG